MPDVSGIRGLVFRANPAYELVVYDRLSPAEKSALAALTSDADFYGILRPKAPGLNLKSVNRDLALLFSTLANPGTMPSYVEAELGRSFAGFVTQLVLDQVFEVEHEGTFVSAAGAQHLFVAERAHRPASRISELSQRAVQYAQHLDIDEAAILGARIYFYNRQPASLQLAAEFLGEGRLAKHLGIDEETPFGARLKQKWSEVPDEPALQGWRMWRSKRRRKENSEIRIQAIRQPTNALAWRSVSRLRRSFRARRRPAIQSRTRSSRDPPAGQTGRVLFFRR